MSSIGMSMTVWQKKFNSKVADQTSLQQHMGKNIIRKAFICFKTLLPVTANWNVSKCSFQNNCVQDNWVFSNLFVHETIQSLGFLFPYTVL
jgi:hypothetical protein